MVAVGGLVTINSTVFSGNSGEGTFREQTKLNKPISELQLKGSHRPESLAAIIMLILRQISANLTLVVSVSKTRARSHCYVVSSGGTS